MQSIGIDVSKAKLDCCWLRDPEAVKLKTKVFKNTAPDHRKLGQWILAQTKSLAEEIHIVMEATGVYHEPLAYALYELGFQVSVVNPARTKEFSNSLGATHKTDAKDSLMLAQFGHRMKPGLWQPEPPEARELKALLARLEALEFDLQREMNRREKADFSGLSQRVFDSLEHMIKTFKEEKRRLEHDIDDHIDRHPQLKKNRELMASIPGVGPVLSRTILSVIHSRDFTSAGQLSAYLGLIPRIQQSGQWKGRSRLTKQGPSRVRAKLYMAAVVATKANPDIKRQYERLQANGKCKMQALGAAMRKLVQICFGVVKHQSEYRPQLIC